MAKNEDLILNFYFLLVINQTKTGQNLVIDGGLSAW